MSLVELMAALTLGTILIGIAISGFASLMRLDSRFADGRTPWMRHAELIETLRADTHAGERFRFEPTDKPTDAGATWNFRNAAGEETRYSLGADGRVERRLVGQPGQPRVFRLPAGSRLSAKPTAAEANSNRGLGALVRFELTLPGEPSDPPTVYPISICLGRDASIERRLDR